MNIADTPPGARARPHFSSAASQDRGACHALSVRAPRALASDALARHALLWLRSCDLDPGSVSVDAATCNADSEQAERLRERERRLVPSACLGRRVRAHVFAWRDGQAELLVVAHRAALDTTTLLDLPWAVVRGNVAAVRATASASGPAPALPDTGRLPEFDWGLGNPVPHGSRARAAAPGFAPGMDLPTRLAALALALARFEARGTLSLAVDGHPALDEAAQYGFLGVCRALPSSMR